MQDGETASGWNRAQLDAAVVPGGAERRRGVVARVL